MTDEGLADLAMEEAANDESAVSRIAAGPFGLGVSIFSRDVSRARSLGSRLACGFVVVKSEGRQLAYLDVTDHSKDEFLNYLTDRFVANYQWRIDRMGKVTPEQSKERKDRYAFQQKQLPLMMQLGMQLVDYLLVSQTKNCIQ